MSTSNFEAKHSVTISKKKTLQTEKDFDNPH